jgi:hypothetical protein
MSFISFTSFVNNTINNENDPNAIILNGYTTFLMCKKNERNNIKEHRMEWMVNNYVNYDNVDKRPYYEYYKNNIQDPYSGIFNPPPCFYNEMVREERKKQEEAQKEWEEYHNDDIAMHYREIANKHLTRYDMMKEDSECMSDLDYQESIKDEEDNESYITEEENDYYNDDNDDFSEYYEDDDCDY